MQLLVIDHRDSFTFNLVDIFRRQGAHVTVAGPDQIPPSIIGYDALLLSPGPGRPADYPETLTLLKRWPAERPLLGVCLGMQCLAVWSGDAVVHAPVPMHGKVSAITHTGGGIFAQIPSPCTVMRYHSLACRITSPEWQVTATAPDGVPMAMQHVRRPWHAVQFHPESFQTPQGERMLQNWVQP